MARPQHNTTQKPNPRAAHAGCCSRGILLDTLLNHNHARTFHDKKTLLTRPFLTFHIRHNPNRPTPLFAPAPRGEVPRQHAERSTAWLVCWRTELRGRLLSCLSFLFVERKRATAQTNPVDKRMPRPLIDGRRSTRLSLFLFPHHPTQPYYPEAEGAERLLFSSLVCATHTLSVLFFLLDLQPTHLFDSFLSLFASFADCFTLCEKTQPPLRHAASWRCLLMLPCCLAPSLLR